MSSTVASSLAAEVRAVEEGHRAFLTNDGAIRVVSDSDDRLAYRVEAASVDVIDGEILFICETVDRRTNRPVLETHGRKVGAPGLLPCKHAGVAARRLEREGLAEVRNGLWHATELAAEILRSRRPTPPSDPFDGLT